MATHLDVRVAQGDERLERAGDIDSVDVGRELLGVHSARCEQVGPARGGRGRGQFERRRDSSCRCASTSQSPDRKSHSTPATRTVPLATVAPAALVQLPLDEGDPFAANIQRDSRVARLARLLETAHGDPARLALDLVEPELDGGEVDAWLRRRRRERRLQALRLLEQRCEGRHHL